MTEPMSIKAVYERYKHIMDYGLPAPDGSRPSDASVALFLWAAIKAAAEDEPVAALPCRSCASNPHHCPAPVTTLDDGTPHCDSWHPKTEQQAVQGKEGRLLTYEEYQAEMAKLAEWQHGQSDETVRHNESVAIRRAQDTKTARLVRAETLRDVGEWLMRLTEGDSHCHVHVSDIGILQQGHRPGERDE